MDINFADKISLNDYNFLRNSVNWKLLSQRQIENIFKNSAYFTVATVENKPVAMARVITDGGYIYFVADVIVLPEYQGHGIGRMILTNVMDYIKSNLYEGEFALANLMSVKGKETLYEKFGFQRRPNNEFGDGMTQWLVK